MRKWITFLMTFLVGSASYVNATMGDVNVFAGYRHDSVELKNRVPSKLFKEKTRFEDVDIFQIGANVRSTLGCNFYGRAEATMGWVLSGDVVKSSSLESCGGDSGSYGFNTFDKVKFKNLIDDKYVYDANIAIGYPFYFCDCTAVMAPVFGYAVNTQHFSGNGRNVAVGRNSDDGDYLIQDCNDCCKHSFLQRWYGPFVGVDFNYRPFNDCFNFYAAFEYHFGRCKVKRTIDNDNDRDRFNNHIDMDGYVVDLGADYILQDQWTVGLYFKYTDFSGSKRHHDWNGDDSDSSGSHRGRRHTDWTSYAINVELGKSF